MSDSLTLKRWHVRLKPRPRGFHIVTGEIESAVRGFDRMQNGLCHVFIQHTSAGLTLNENADPDVRTDFESIFTRLVPENEPYYVHTFEGSDDMPAHAKASLLGASVTVPIENGRMALGTWQGIYLCEHRDRASGRSIVVTAIGTV